MIYDTIEGWLASQPMPQGNVNSMPYKVGVLETVTSGLVTSVSQLQADVLELQTTGAGGIGGKEGSPQTLRHSLLTIDEANPGVTGWLHGDSEGFYNGYEIAAGTPTKGATAGIYTLNSDGKLFSVNFDTFSENVHGIVAVFLYRIDYSQEYSAVPVKMRFEKAPGNNIMYFRFEDDDNNYIDLTDADKFGYAQIGLTYLTSDAALPT